MDLHQIRLRIVFLEKQKTTRRKISWNWEKHFFLLARHLQSVCNHNTLKRWNHNTDLFSYTALSSSSVCRSMFVCMSHHIHPFLLSPVVAELVIQPSSSGGPLCCHPAYASLHEAQWLLPSAHLLQQSPDVRLENSLEDRSKKKKKSLERIGSVENFWLICQCFISSCRPCPDVLHLKIPKNRQIWTWTEAEGWDTKKNFIIRLFSTSVKSHFITGECIEHREPVISCYLL